MGTATGQIISLEELSAQAEPLLRVSGSSNAKSLATVLTHLVVRQEKTVRMRSIGASAVNQAVKAVAIARDMARGRGQDLVCQPQFETITMPDGDTSSVVIVVRGEHP